MLMVYTNRSGFEYDIHSLVKAFYPEEEVKVSVDTASADRVFNMQIQFMEDCIKVQLPDSSAIQGETSEAVAMGVETEAPFHDKMDRQEINNILKRLLYDCLSSYTGQQLPWGTLTGIRPTKIPMNLLEGQTPDREIRRYMKHTYYVSDVKIDLALNIAKREREILKERFYQDGYSLYVGIPFCPTTCLYCSFTSYPIAKWRKQVDDYLDVLDREIDYFSKRCKGKRLDSVYIGGGTPTTLEPEQLERILVKVRACFDCSHVKEFTVEAGRADSITEPKLLILKRYGVDRISINPQTMKQETLNIIGRRHTVVQVKEAYALARALGFTNINMDLILGLPGETSQDIAATMEGIISLGPDSITVHSLAVKRASGLQQWIAEHGMGSLRNTEETMQIAGQAAEAMGMQPYYLYRQKNMSGNFENIGYATPGHYGLYNILMMEEIQTILALGAGTVSKWIFEDGRIERCDTVKEIPLYLERIDEMIARKHAFLQQWIDQPYL